MNVVKKHSNVGSTVILYYAGTERGSLSLVSYPTDLGNKVTDRERRMPDSVQDGQWKLGYNARRTTTQWIEIICSFFLHNFLFYNDHLIYLHTK